MGGLFCEDPGCEDPWLCGDLFLSVAIPELIPGRRSWLVCDTYRGIPPVAHVALPTRGRVTAEKIAHLRG